MKRYKRTYFLLMTVLIIASLWWAVKVIYIDGGNLIRKQDELAQVEKQIETLNQSVEYYPLIKAQFTKSESDFDTLQYSLSSHNNFVDILEKIRSVAKKQNIRIISFSPDLRDSFPAIKYQLVTTQKHVERIPIQFQFLGDFFSITAMMEEFMNSEEMINIGSIDIESELELGGALTGEMLLYTYWYVAGERAI
ncbi:MAG: type 4a pilus biogenesis protein PilO [FCB group bacterium]|nr:type 4a pilus biogenesis protein PilO [FCB group bacterium]